MATLRLGSRLKKLAELLILVSASRFFPAVGRVYRESNILAKYFALLSGETAMKITLQLDVITEISHHLRVMGHHF